MKTLEMMYECKGNDKTFRTNNLYYNTQHGFHDGNWNNKPWDANAFNTLNQVLELYGWKEVIETVDFKTAYDDCKANGTEYKATYKGKTDIMSIGALSDGTESVSIEAEDGSCFRGLYLLDEWTKV